ncbi:MAG: DEAD/DEAH box helicase [Alphaproteobacteria bacterium]|nr:DEAD/DEAH box helicase [Alphaproteobacteria bacterium]
MFDRVTAEILRSAPALPGLDPSDIPSILTEHYARLVSERLRGGADAATEPEDGVWSLERIADTYELLTSLTLDAGARRASAFVAATANQILARRVDQTGDTEAWSIHRDGVSPALAAAVLFLAAEQYADANEAAGTIRTPPDTALYESRIIADHIRDLARGHLPQIIERATRWRRADRRLTDVSRRAFAALLETLITGIEMLAAETMGRHIDGLSRKYASAPDAFTKVLQLSTMTRDVDGLRGALTTSYPGPRHLAALLLAAYDGLHAAALTRLPPTHGADEQYWKRWLEYRARQFPFVWPNHRDAVKAGFYHTGSSAVLVLPTGAGKTTVSSLKIANVLASGKKVIFLAPTHALVEQLTGDLQEMFPKDILGSAVSSDFDLLLLDPAALNEIEVMTPERCLAMLSFAPEAFANVGLMVFDECHLLSPQSGKIRRALDGMLCVLAFHGVAPEADFLFLSAMLKNGIELARWVEELTGRACVCVDLLWKPSRQARGVVVYKDADLTASKQAALQIQIALDRQKHKVASGLRTVAKKALVARPHAIWGLQHNWLGAQGADCSITTLSSATVLLAGDLHNGDIHLTPNANQVASRLAAVTASAGLKTIVFVNTKADAVSTATSVAAYLNHDVTATDEERQRWEALNAELGGLAHSVLAGPSSAVPHNSSMLRLERDLAERMFRRTNGASVIVATPTLAQGLNLPAQFAILAGDKRAKVDGKGREALEAHEILNAAARAGRAGHLANGVVLLIPEPIISYANENSIDNPTIEKLQAVLPEDDRCVTISDPLEIVLDRLTSGQGSDSDVSYTINRMTALNAGETVSPFDISRSFAAFVARHAAREKEFDAKVDALRAAIANGGAKDATAETMVLASKSGLSITLLQQLRSQIEAQIGILPTTLLDWTGWILDWLASDAPARDALLLDVKDGVLKSTGRKKTAPLDADAVRAMRGGIEAWMTGQTIREIEIALGGSPDGTTDQQRHCMRSRELILNVIPRGLSFVAGLVAHIVDSLDPFGRQPDLEPGVVMSLSTAVRRGFDSHEKLIFAGREGKYLGRVLAHRAWSNASED